MHEGSRCGYVAIIGRPNVGKSTLLNHILGQKISITSRKPQTTRHRLLGIKTQGPVQVVYVDTPGLHQEAKKALNRYMNRAAVSVIDDVDVIIFMVEALKWQENDEWIAKKLQHTKTPIIVALNKVDRVNDKEKLLPFIESLHEKIPSGMIIPVSALKNDNIANLEEAVSALLPEGPHYFPDDQITDATARFQAAEVIREKLMKSLGQELPYELTVQIEEFQKKEQVLHIRAIVWVERTSQKAIVIGKDGGVLKKVGQAARIDLEQRFEMKVFLRVWVKVKESWSDNENALRSLGYQDDSD